MQRPLTLALLVALLVALAACDSVFGVKPPSFLDAPVADAPPDGTAACVSKTLHNEDADDAKDDCDPCPTIADPGRADTDSDGLSDACDPDLSTSVDGDRILLVSTFATANALGQQWTPSGTAMSPTVGNDALTLPAGSQVQTTTAYTPTRIVVEVSAFNGATGTDVLQVASNGVSLTIGAVGCANEPGMGCFGCNAAPSSMPGFIAQQLRRVTVSKDPGGLGLRCELQMVDGPRVTNGAGTFVAAVPFVRAMGGATVTIPSIVIYGER